MNANYDPIASYARRLGDDALIMGQRLCEWTSNAPMLEEDLALSNVALDYLGRARMFYGYAGERLGVSEDELAYFRDDRQFENLLIVELPRGDFAFTMVRQFLLDEFEALFFDQLCTSSDDRFAAISAKSIKEVAYHQRRSGEWLKRLGLGTEESAARAQRALDELWAYVEELFAMDALESTLSQTGFAVDRQDLRSVWLSRVSRALEDARFQVPDHSPQISGGRQGIHTEHLGHLLGEMQFLQRAHPGLSW